MESTEKRPRVEIAYCSQCRFILRAGWLAQELLMTFATDLGEVALIPGEGGIFEIRLDGEVLFSRKREGRFPEAKEIKQKIRDRVAPGKDLGHSDR
ncbi:MAG TPA: SelT/SelW/SelH family protein [Gammaproteobacteria bacterium]|jgi:selenoprotein W-related protein|nr:SelT/SelW/SelH family protein [Gammaproteobacteria bacterium]